MTMFEKSGIGTFARLAVFFNIVKMFSNRKRKKEVQFYIVRL
jgi:hypothetical protein